MIRTPYALRRGFTLIEIMVVIVVIALVSALVIPNLGGSVGGLRIESAARQLAGLMDYCYQSATSTGRVHALLFNDEARAYVVLAEPKADPALPEDVGEPKLEPVALPGFVERELKVGIRLSSVRLFETDLAQDASGGIRLLFFPDGSAEFARLTLVDESENQRIIVLDGMTGAARVINPQAEAAAQKKKDSEDASAEESGESESESGEGGGSE